MVSQSQRGRQLIRQWKILKLLHTTDGMTVDELSHHCEVGRRTIYRDLKILEAAEFQIESKRSGMRIQLSLRAFPF